VSRGGPIPDRTTRERTHDERDRARKPRPLASAAVAISARALGTSRATTTTRVAPAWSSHAYEFQIGREVPAVLARAARRLAGSGAAFNTNQLQEIRRVARETGRLDDQQRMFLAGLLDAENVRVLARSPIRPGATIGFSLGSIQAGMPQIRALGRPRRDASTVARARQAVVQREPTPPTTRGTSENTALKEFRAKPPLTAVTLPSQDPKYVDYVIDSVTAMLVLADRYTLRWRGGEKTVWNRDIDWKGTSHVVPLINIYGDEAGARAAAGSWAQDVKGDDHVVAYYRSPDGVVMPTWISPDSAPGVYRLIVGVHADIRRDAKAWEEIFRQQRNALIVGAVLGGVFRIAGMSFGGGRAPAEVPAPSGSRPPLPDVEPVTPSTATPSTAKPPAAEPPTVEPRVAKPPTVEPPAGRPSATEPAVEVGKTTTEERVSGTTAKLDAREAFDKATAARDQQVKSIKNLPKSKRQDIATVTAGTNVETGETAAGWNQGGQCAEDVVVRKLGGDASKIRFSKAIRPRTNQEVPVCERCQGKYTRNQFPDGTKFQ
jgi:hypothetical protein